MLTRQQTLSGGACLHCLVLWNDTIALLFQGEPQITPLPKAELKDGSDIADPSLVSVESTTPDEDAR